VAELRPGERPAARIIIMQSIIKLNSLPIQLLN
jgi:hypothetical protein